MGDNKEFGACPIKNPRDKTIKKNSGRSRISQKGGGSGGHQPVGLGQDFCQKLHESESGGGVRVPSAPWIRQCKKVQNYKCIWFTPVADF